MPHIRGNQHPFKVRWLRADRLGVFTGLVQQYHPVGTEGQRVDPNWLLNPPEMWGLDNGFCEISYNYEGKPADSPQEPTDEQTLFELDTSMAEEPIETHPAFAELKKLYGWDQSERRFAEMLSETPGGTNALSSANNQKNKKNPLFGTDSWLVVGAIFRRTRALTSIPGDALTGIGTIVKSPPNIGQFRLPTEGTKRRNWLKLSPKLSRRGNSVQCSEEWMMSGPNGWLEPVYSSGQLDQ
jgi:hypothetical protein